MLVNTMQRRVHGSKMEEAIGRWRKGRAIAQAVSRWLPTAAVRDSRPGLSCGILWWTKWRWGYVFSEYFGFPCQIAPKIILIYHRGLYNRPNWPQYQGLRYLGTQYRHTNNKKIKNKKDGGN
jgi:hypothetical protein